MVTKNYRQYVDKSLLTTANELNRQGFKNFQNLF